MNLQTLRAAQAPLKAKYREDADSGIVRMTASATLGDTVNASIETKYGIINAGLHPAAGGSGKELCSGDMLMESIAACAGVTLNAVATALEIEFRKAVVTATGDLDFRGTLGVSKDAPVGFKNINLHFALDTDAPDDKIEALLKLTERYCVVFQTLNNKPEMTTTYKKESSENVLFSQ